LVWGGDGLIPFSNSKGDLVGESAWVVVSADGALQRHSSPGITVRHANRGDYDVQFPADMSYSVCIATLGRHDNAPQPESGLIKTRKTNDPHVIRVTTTDRRGNEEDRGFHLLVVYLPTGANDPKEPMAVIPSRVYTTGLERLHGSFAIGERDLLLQIGRAIYCEMDGTDSRGRNQTLRYMRDFSMSGEAGWLYEERGNSARYEYFFARDKAADFTMGRRPRRSNSHWEPLEAAVCDWDTAPATQVVTAGSADEKSDQQQAEQSQQQGGQAAGDCPEASDAEPVRPFKIGINGLENDRLKLGRRFSLKVFLNQRVNADTKVRFEYTILEHSPNNAPEFRPIGAGYLVDKVFEATVDRGNNTVTTSRMKISLNPLDSNDVAVETPHVLVVIAYIDGAAVPAYHAATIRIVAAEE